ncbi:MAG: hypothetical protein IPQ12_07095 [Polaromonas sp.]|nr:hypothetical protein [Polaromonas sp.]
MIQIVRRKFVETAPLVIKNTKLPQIRGQGFQATSRKIVTNCPNHANRATSKKKFKQQAAMSSLEQMKASQLIAAQVQ